MRASSLNDFKDCVQVAQTRTKQALDKAPVTEGDKELEIHMQKTMSNVTVDFARGLGHLATSLSDYTLDYTIFLAEVHTHMLQLPVLLEQISLTWSALLAERHPEISQDDEDD